MVPLFGLFWLLFGLSLAVPHRRIARQTQPSDRRVVCYYANWSVYRPGDQRFTPEDIQPHLCTHILYAFATLERDVGLVPFDPKQDIQLEGYKKFIELKEMNPDVQLLLSVGGTREGSKRFSSLAADPELRGEFVRNGAAFLRQYQFDGLDLVWQYPGFREGSSANDKVNYVQLVKELREEFEKEALVSSRPSLQLSMAVPALGALIDRGFDMQLLPQYLDFMSVLNYDYHTPNEPSVNHHAPLYPLPYEIGTSEEELNIDNTIRTYLSRGVDPWKLNLGLPLYGISFILEDPEETDLGAPTEGEALGREPGVLLYNQICKMIVEERWTVRHANRTALGPYAYRDDLWVAYDDEQAVANKARYAGQMGLGGIMFWSMDQDDFRGRCNGRTYPLIKSGIEALASVPPRPPSTFTTPPTPPQTSARLPPTWPTPAPQQPVPTRRPEISRPPPERPQPSPQRPQPAPQRPQPAPQRPQPAPQRPQPAPQRPSPPRTQPPQMPPVNPPLPVPDTRNPDSPPRPPEESFPDFGMDIPPAEQPLPELPFPSPEVPQPSPELPGQPPASPDYYDSSFPGLRNFKVIKSQRDILFQNVRLWITNNFY